jgi:hypothetical protein
MKARPSSFAIRLLPLAILIITQCLLTAALQIGMFFFLTLSRFYKILILSCARQVYVDERASYLPGRPCGGSADEPCPTLADAFGGSHLLKSTDYEVPPPLLAPRPVSCAPHRATVQGSFSMLTDCLTCAGADPTWCVPGVRECGLRVHRQLHQVLLAPQLLLLLCVVLAKPLVAASPSA